MCYNQAKEETNLDRNEVMELFGMGFSSRQAITKEGSM